MADPDDQDVARELAALHRRPAMERAAYLMELGWSREGQPTPELEPWLDDEDPLVRVAAAHACWQTGTLGDQASRLVNALAGGLLSGEEDLSLTAGTALSNMGRIAVQPLMRIFVERGEEDPLIVRVLGEIGGEEVIAWLQRAAGAESCEVAAEARAALEGTTPGVPSSGRSR